MNGRDGIFASSGLRTAPGEIIVKDADAYAFINSLSDKPHTITIAP